LKVFAVLYARCFKRGGIQCRYRDRDILDIFGFLLGRDNDRIAIIGGIVVFGLRECWCCEGNPRDSGGRYT
jgi:hypothetical protein